MPDVICVVMVRIAELAIRVGAAPINALPGCWEYQISPEWWVAVNGHGHPVPSSHRDRPVPGYHAYIEFNGWPWGLINPRGGTAFYGAAANEDTLLAALDAAPLPESPP